MTDEEGYIIEAALAYGFVMINDDGDIFQCSEEQLINFVKTLRQ